MNPKSVEREEHKTIGTGSEQWKTHKTSKKGALREKKKILLKKTH